jgi:hypothetical protein
MTEGAASGATPDSLLDGVLSSNAGEAAPTAGGCEAVLSAGAAIAGPTLCASARSIGMATSKVRIVKRRFMFLPPMSGLRDSLATICMKSYMAPPFEEQTFALASIIPHIVQGGTYEYSQTGRKMSS